MSEVPEELLGKAKRTLEGLNWVYVIVVLGGIGLVLFLIWYFLMKRKEKEKK